MTNKSENKKPPPPEWALLINQHSKKIPYWVSTHKKLPANHPVKKPATNPSIQPPIRAPPSLGNSLIINPVDC
jgi:hypothetical protein